MASDEEDLRRFFDGPYVRILHVVSLASDSHAEAQDAVHEAIARAWERRDRIEHFDRWVLTVAMNLVYSRWRRLLRSRPRVIAGATAPEVDVATAEWLLVLRELPNRQRQVAVLHYVEDLPVSVIAELLGISDGAVKNALFHARRALAAALEPSEVEESTP